MERELSALENEEVSLSLISATYTVRKPTILPRSRKRNKIVNDLRMHKEGPTSSALKVENMLV